jgi:hypothetical protein
LLRVCYSKNLVFVDITPCINNVFRFWTWELKFFGFRFLGVGENRERSVFSNNCTCINFSFLFSTGAAVGAAFTANLGAAAAAAGTAVTSGLGAAASLLSSAAAGASSGGGSPGGEAPGGAASGSSPSPSSGGPSGGQRTRPKRKVINFVTFIFL